MSYGVLLDPLDLALILTSCGCAGPQRAARMTCGANQARLLIPRPPHCEDRRLWAGTLPAASP